ncbi:MAG TPA: hypothetical protein VFE31_00050 [Opitutaceae bacterium]|jgi:adenosylhomocysteine nucleosidase|nr:hypothetical protein [Opitutaceae bacterium]
MKRGVIIAALPAELRPLVRGWRRRARGSAEVWERPEAAGGWRWTAACAGIGRAAALRALAAAEAAAGPADRIVSAGFAGALTSDCVPGRVYAPDVILDGGDEGGSGVPAALEGRGTAGTPRPLTLVTADRVLSVEDKVAFRRQFGAHLVDMEAAALAEAARSRGVAFACLKGVSDGPGDRVPGDPSFIGPEGRLRYGPLILHALSRPRDWAAFLRVGQNSAAAARGLKTALLAVMDDTA